MDNFERLIVNHTTLADAIAKLVMQNVRGTIERNYGITGNDVMWSRYLHEQRTAVLEYLKKEVRHED